MDFGEDKGKRPDFDLNLPAEDDGGLDFPVGFEEIQEETGNSRGMESCPDVETGGSSSKRMRLTVEGKGKAVEIGSYGNAADQSLGLDHGGARGDLESMNTWVPSGAERPGRLEVGGNLYPFELIAAADYDQQRMQEEPSISTMVRLLPPPTRRRRREEPQPPPTTTTTTKTITGQPQIGVELGGDSRRQNSSFNLEWESPPGAPSELVSQSGSENGEGIGASTELKREAPKLLQLSLDVLVRNADAIVSLECVPDELRHKLSKGVGDDRRVDARFFELLARGSPQQIRVWDASKLTEEDFIRIFRACDTRDLTVLQLDLCGQCMSDAALRDALGSSSSRLPALATISLRGAHRLTDSGLRVVASSAPALKSINLSQCTLISSDGIKVLASSFESTLRELFIDECLNVEAMSILPALQKLKHLEVLSVARIPSVSDDFVIGVIDACGVNIKELGFANCVKLTDKSFEMVAKTCPNLYSLDISHLNQLKESTLQHLAKGCPAICSLKLCRNRFSDEAVAVFLKASGKSLRELSLNNISQVAEGTALSIAEFSRNLVTLDISWCRGITDKALRLIMNKCLSLRRLKIFGCTQITDVSVKGHSESKLQVIGYKMTSVMKHLDLLEPLESPLRYSSHAASAQQSLGPS